MFEGVMRRSLAKKSCMIEKDPSRRQTMHGIPQFEKLFRKTFTNAIKIFGKKLWYYKSVKGVNTGPTLVYKAVLGNTTVQTSKERRRP